MALTNIAGLPGKVELAYLVAASMAADVIGDPIQVGPLARLRLDVAWTGTPTGTFTLEARTLDGSTWRTVPGASLEFTSQPAGSAGVLMPYWYQMQGFDAVRLRYTRTSGTGALSVAYVTE